MDEKVPLIRPSFIKTMVEKYGDTEEHASMIADRFIQVFMDAVNYGFSINHSMAYSYIGYISGYLRYYYPLEFCTAALQIWKNKQEKTNRIVTYAENHGIKILPPKYGKSKGDYFFDKENNTIYQGTAPIKENNGNVGDTLYEISKEYKFDSFSDLLLAIYDRTLIHFSDRSILPFKLYQEGLDTIIDLDKKAKAKEVNLEQLDSFAINKTKMLGLIRLDFFNEFGNSKHLENTFNLFQSKYKAKNKLFKGKYEAFQNIKNYENDPDNQKDEFSIVEKCEFELYYTGRVTTTAKEISPKFAFVTEIVNEGKTRTTANVFNINKGINTQIKVASKTYKIVPFHEGDLIMVMGTETKNKKEKVGGRWVTTDKQELWVTQLKAIRKAKLENKKGKRK